MWREIGMFTGKRCFWGSRKESLGLFWAQKGAFSALSHDVLNENRPHAAF